MATVIGVQLQLEINLRAASTLPSKKKLHGRDVGFSFILMPETPDSLGVCAVTGMVGWASYF